VPPAPQQTWHMATPKSSGPKSSSHARHRPPLQQPPAPPAPCRPAACLPSGPRPCCAAACLPGGTGPPAPAGVPSKHPRPSWPLTEAADAWTAAQLGLLDVVRVTSASWLEARSSAGATPPSDGVPRPRAMPTSPGRAAAALAGGFGVAGGTLAASVPPAPSSQNDTRGSGALSTSFTSSRRATMRGDIERTANMTSRTGDLYAARGQRGRDRRLACLFSRAGRGEAGEGLVVVLSSMQHDGMAWLQHQAGLWVVSRCNGGAREERRHTCPPATLKPGLQPPPAPLPKPAQEVKGREGYWNAGERWVAKNCVHQACPSHATSLQTHMCVRSYGCTLTTASFLCLPATSSPSAHSGPLTPHCSPSPETRLCPSAAQPAQAGG
jgi:hypothetical protein